MAKLVAIGDSLTMGFQSGGVQYGKLSYPSMMAEAMNLRVGSDEFRIPDFSPLGGLPLSIEHVLRNAMRANKRKVSIKKALITAQRVQNYWERQAGNRPVEAALHHNLGVAGFEVSDAYDLDAGECANYINATSSDRVDVPIVDNWRMRLGRRVLNPSHSNEEKRRKATQVSIAREIAETEGGIENLVVWLGANNCLGAGVRGVVKWTEDDTVGSLTGGSHLRTLWRPRHFAAEYDRLIAELETIPNVEHVFIGTVPKLDLLSLFIPVERIKKGRSISYKLWDYNRPERIADGYVYFFETVSGLDPRRNQLFLTRSEFTAIDNAIDAYNEHIRKRVQGKPNWHLVDLEAYTSRLSRYALHRDRSVLPEPFANLGSWYFHPTSSGTLQGSGLVALDGIHPTMCGYSLVAQHLIEAIRKARGADKTYVKDIDFEQVLARDPLVSNPPPNIGGVRDLLRRLEKRFNITGHMGF